MLDRARVERADRYRLRVLKARAEACAVPGARVPYRWRYEVKRAPREVREVGARAAEAWVERLEQATEATLARGLELLPQAEDPASVLRAACALYDRSRVAAGMAASITEERVVSLSDEERARRVAHLLELARERERLALPAGEDPPAHVIDNVSAAAAPESAEARRARLWGRSDLRAQDSDAGPDSYQSEGAIEDGPELRMMPDGTWAPIE